MSPEQVRGQEVDSRSDIFSLGAVFYEMLTVERAFRGESAIETMNAILKDDPPELPASMPPAVERIVRRCLEKRPGERFQSALDLAFALESLSGSSDRKTSPEVVITRRPHMLRKALIGAVAIAIFIAGELVHALLTRPQKPAAYSGLLLAGPEDGLCPRISPDGHLLAFMAVIGEDSQVAVMKPESGNYTVLTHDRTRGPISDLSWSPDGNEIYYDRQTDLPHGIFRVPALGGDERIVLEDALAPEVLPDRSMLLSRMNQSGQLQLTRYWPETGKFREFDFEVLQSAVSGSIVLRPFPDGKEAVALGLPLGKGRELGPRPWIIDINTGAMRSVVPPEEHGPFSAIAVTHNGQSVLVSISAGSLYQVLAYPRNGRASKRILFSVMSSPVTMDSGPDGSVYIDQVARPITIARFPESGGHIERLADLGEQTPQLPALAALPDGRLVVQQVTAGRTRLLVIDPGKSPAQFLQTNESTEGPIAPTANGDIAFLIGPNRGNAIAIASVASGRLLQRIPFTEGPVDSLAATPDGKTIYCASSGSIWAITTSDGRVTKLREGSGLALDVAHNSLIIESRRGQSFRLLRYAIQGGATAEIPMNGPVRIGAIKISGLIGPKDTLLAPGTLPDSWFQPPITIDLATGAMKPVHEDLPADYLALAWTPDGRIAAVAYELRAMLWRFQPEKP